MSLKKDKKKKKKAELLGAQLLKFVDSTLLPLEERMSGRAGCLLYLDIYRLLKANLVGPLECAITVFSRDKENLELNNPTGQLKLISRKECGGMCPWSQHLQCGGIRVKHSIQSHPQLHNNIRAIAT